MLPDYHAGMQQAPAVWNARELQMDIIARMTPAQRLRLMGRLTASALACRESCLREQNPDADEARLRQLRIEATLASSPSMPLC